VAGIALGGLQKNGRTGKEFGIADVVDVQVRQSELVDVVGWDVDFVELAAQCSWDAVAQILVPKH
jgi:hypothetical protein